MKKNLFNISVIFLVITFSHCRSTQQNITSKSIGTVSNGKLINGKKIKYKGKNYKYYSPFAYYILRRGYLHSTVEKIVVETYDAMADLYPKYTFRVMECSKKKGGRPFPHQTHQNGTSIDFMTPLRKNGKYFTRYDKIGIWRYTIEFDEQGIHRRKKKVSIDFDMVAKHILTLEKVARKHDYRIRKVILETNLKDEIYKSKYGRALKKSRIYFVKSLSKRINRLHDDHYHIDLVKM